jgi:hypothetical protein
VILGAAAAVFVCADHCPGGAAILGMAVVLSVWLCSPRICLFVQTTVLEALRFSARLRLSAAVHAADLRLFVDEVTYNWTSCP